ncbi:YdcF family protein [Micromonospora chersina]|uniref:YdcF family protein n=1 Tax=Micromonospora chersina TaxID=47854 RepID=UPI003D8D660B
MQLLDIMAGPHGAPPTPTQPIDILVVFGAADPQLAYDAVQLGNLGSVSCVIFTGGVGRDSGPLAALGIAEADFLASIAIAAGLPPDTILIERSATNAVQNATLSLRTASAAGRVRAGTTVASSAPAQRSRRLYEELRFQAAKFDPSIEVITGLSSGRAAVNLASQETLTELANELRGRTMHALDIPRISPLPEFQTGGQYADLAHELNG